MISVKSTTRLIPAALLAFHGLSEAYLTVRMAEAATAVWKNPGDATCSNWGAGWYRTNCYNALRDKAVEGYVEFRMNNIEHRRHEIPAFTNLVDLTDVVPSREYYAYGVTEDFTVPETKDYTFTSHGNSYMFIAIDGQLQGPADKVWLISFDEEEKRGTVYPDKWPLQGSAFAHPNRYPGGKEYSFTKRMEKGKKYKLEMFYAHHSETSYGMFSVDGEAVPKEWFGEVVAVGNPEAAWLKPGLSEVMTGVSPFAVDFEAGVAMNPSGGAVSYLWDFDGDGTVDKTTTTPTVRYEYANTTEELAFFIPSVVIEIDGKKSREVKGPVVYVGKGDPSASIVSGRRSRLLPVGAGSAVQVNPLGRRLAPPRAGSKPVGTPSGEHFLRILD